METPLLAGDGDNDCDYDAPHHYRGNVPSLSSGPLVLEETEEEFSRLIAQRCNMSGAVATASPFWNDGGLGLGLGQSWAPDGSVDASSMGAVGRILANDRPPSSLPNRLRAGSRGVVPDIPLRGRWGIVTASALFLVFLGFMWASYGSTAWTKTQLVLQGPLPFASADPWRVPLPPPHTLATWLQSLHEQLRESYASSSASSSPTYFSSSVLMLEATIAALWVVALALPCLFMVLAPSWILVNSQPWHVVDIDRRIRHPTSPWRWCLELGLRCSWLVVSLALWGDAAAALLSTTSSSSAPEEEVVGFGGAGDFSSIGARVTLRTQYVEGLAAFVLATVAAVGTVCALRAPPSWRPAPAGTTAAWPPPPTVPSVPGTVESEPPSQPSATAAAVANAAAAALVHVRTPPRRAFRLLPPLRLPRGLSSSDPSTGSPLVEPLLAHRRSPEDRNGVGSGDNEIQQQQQQEEAEEEAHDGDQVGNHDTQDNDATVNNDDEDDDQVSMALLEETPPAWAATEPAGAPLPSASSISTPALTALSLVRTHTPRKDPRRHCRRVTFCHKVLVFQLGLLTVVLWMPCWYTPFWRATAPSPRRSTGTVAHYWGEIPFQLRQRALEAGTDPWIVALLEFWAVVSLLVVPLLASGLGLGVWLGEGRWSVRCRHWLYCLQPALGGVVASTALLAWLQLRCSFHPAAASSSSSSSTLSCGAGLFALGWGGGGGSCGIGGPFGLDWAADYSSRTIELRSGAWSWVFQSLALEVFVGLTLQWSLLPE